MAATVNNVTLGDKFATSKHHKFQVVDLLEKRSLVTGDVAGYICIAEPIETPLASNRFEVPFSTVVRNRIK